MTNDLSGAGRSWRFPAQVNFSDRRIRIRRGAPFAFQVPVILILVLMAVILSRIVGEVLPMVGDKLILLLTFGGIGTWRWGWFLTQSVRAILYRYWAYPRLWRSAMDALHEHGPVPEVTILAVTYKEKIWITEAVFTSVFRELSSVRGLARAPKVVVATGCDEDDRSVRRIHEAACAGHRPRPGEPWPPELVILRGDTGKRPAIAAALHAINEAEPNPDGVVVFMDGDTIMQPGLMNRILPLFRLKPDVSALTTNEDGWVMGPRWFAEWISLRFGLRHRTMCSIALSGKLLCLTGRLSAFRASVTSDSSFLTQVHRDSIHHWLWDSFDMLSGDDKSTWFWLAARGHRMLYVPDAMATTLEVVAGSAIQRAFANIRRWSGNSLRHSWRAFMLGPGKLGWFCWYSLLDQRLAIWTVLVGPLLAVLALLGGRWEIGAGYLLWVLFSRMAHAAISWRHGRRFSAYYLPLQILADWAIALVKVWVLFHPAKQNWFNRGARSLDSTRGSGFHRLRTCVAHYLYGVTCCATVLMVGVVSGLVPIRDEARLFLGRSVPPSAPSVVLAGPANRAPAELASAVSEDPSRMEFRPPAEPTVFGSH